MLKLRMLSQGIAGPRFERPEEVVEWMGAMQAQEIRAAKWAVGLRIAKPSLTAVQEAQGAPGVGNGVLVLGIEAQALVLLADLGHVGDVVKVQLLCKASWPNKRGLFAVQAPNRRNSDRTTSDVPGSS